MTCKNNNIQYKQNIFWKRYIYSPNPEVVSFSQRLVHKLIHQFIVKVLGFSILAVYSLVLFTNPSARAGYDTRSVFKQSLTGLNSEFSFS